MEKKINIVIGVIIIILILGLIIYKYLSADYFVVPEIELIGEKNLEVNVNEKFNDPGVKATINGKDASELVKKYGEVNTKKIGKYKIKYVITNYKGKQKKSVTRNVTVKDDVSPQITLNGGNEYSVEVGSVYVDPGYVASDNLDGDITNKVKVTGKVNTKKIGTYELTYEVSDSSNNEFKITRMVYVVDTTAPAIYLKGSNPLYINVNDNYIEAGYRAIDNNDGDITSDVVVNNNIVSSTAGVYQVSYTVYDEAGNYNRVNRIVYVGSEAERSANTYVAVSISEQYLWFYKNGELLVSSPVVTGLKGVYDTPKGNYQILSKSRNIYLTGPDYRSFVNFWMRITPSQIGLHDASWRSYFGGSIYLSNGSHGCINLPYYVAQIIYENTTIGTKVTIY